MLKKIDQDAMHTEEEREELLSRNAYFSTPIYTIYKPEFLSSVKSVSDRLLDKARIEKNISEEIPLVMSENFFAEEELQDFVSFVGNTAWNILSEQGYLMDQTHVRFTEMWSQEHKKHSLMEQHTHRFGSQIVGFYFLEVPENSPRVVFYDPRVAHVQSSLPEKDPTTLSSASTTINYEPRPGLLLFTNSWLAHSFTRNMSDDAFTLVHFNLTTMPAPQEPSEDASSVEIV